MSLHWVCFSCESFCWVYFTKCNSYDCLSDLSFCSVLFCQLSFCRVSPAKRHSSTCHSVKCHTDLYHSASVILPNIILADVILPNVILTNVILQSLFCQALFCQALLWQRSFCQALFCQMPFCQMSWRQSEWKVYQNCSKDFPTWGQNNKTFYGGNNYFKPMPFPLLAIFTLAWHLNVRLKPFRLELLAGIHYKNRLLWPCPKLFN